MLLLNTFVNDLYVVWISECFMEYLMHCEILSQSNLIYEGRSGGQRARHLIRQSEFETCQSPVCIFMLKLFEKDAACL